MNKKYINHATVASYLSLVVEKMYNDGFDPDLVVGLSRGGLVPGIMLSHFLKKPFVPIEASLRDHPTWNANSEKFSQVSKICIIDLFIFLIRLQRSSSEKYRKKFSSK